MAAGGAIGVGELGNEEPRRRLTGAQPAPARELTEADRQALARAEDKRARKRFKRALMNAKGRGWPGRPRPCAPVSLAGAGWAPVGRRRGFSTCQLADADGVGLGLKARPKSGGPGLYRLQRARCSPCRVLKLHPIPIARLRFVLDGKLPGSQRYHAGQAIRESLSG